LFSSQGREQAKQLLAKKGGLKSLKNSVNDIKNEMPLTPLLKIKKK